MEKLHTYSTDARNRFKTISFIAGFTFIFCSGVLKAVSFVSEMFIIGLYPIIFTAAYWVYDKKLWFKFNSGIPDLRGTWVGCTLPNYQKKHMFPHLAIVKIEQTWSDIYLHEDAYYKNESHEDWDLEKQLGYNESITANFNGITSDRSNLHAQIL